MFQLRQIFEAFHLSKLYLSWYRNHKQIINKPQKFIDSEETINIIVYIN